MKDFGNVNAIVSGETIERKEKLGRHITWKHVVLAGLTRLEELQQKAKKARK